MTDTTAQHDKNSDGIITIQTLQTTVEALRRRGDIHNGGIKSWIRDVIVRWDELMPAQGEEFRTDESVLEQHFLASLPKGDWRVLYGMDSPETRELVGEIERRRRNGQSLEGLAWPPSDDPYAPANDPHHPYYLG